MDRGIVLLLISVLALVPAVAQEEPQAGAGTPDWLKQLMGTAQEALGEAVQDQFDEWVGTYEGRITELKLVERRGNRLVLDVRFEGIKRTDGVNIEGEALNGGVPLAGFSNELTPVHGGSGVMRLAILYAPAAADDWGTDASAELESDQVRLSLVRETHPDRPFGSLTYDLPKVWTGTEEPDEPDVEEEAVALAEDEAMEGEPVFEPQAVFVPAGSVLRPVQVRPVQAQAHGTVKAPAVSTPVRPGPVGPVKAGPRYDLYEKAPKAFWQASGSGKLPFPGQPGDRRGYVRALAKATLSTGNQAVKVVQSHPEGRGRGWISGTYPPVILEDGMRFRAVAGFLQGAEGSDGVRFSVRVGEGRRNYRLLSRLVRPNQYVNLEGDLSRWSGKTIRIILRVDAGGTATGDLSVWVSPRLEVSR